MPADSGSGFFACSSSFIVSQRDSTNDAAGTKQTERDVTEHLVVGIAIEGRAAAAAGMRYPS